MGADAAAVDGASDADVEKDRNGYSRDGVVPTSLALCQNDLTKLAVAYTDAKIRIFEATTGKLVMTLKGDETYDGTSASQISRIVCHPTLPLLVSAHEDNYVRFFDLKTGACIHSMIAHSSSVTAVDIDPAGLTLCTASQDCSLRFWDLLSIAESSSSSSVNGSSAGANGSTTSVKCIQELDHSHRRKSEEGVLDVRFHPSLPFVASAGADGGLKVYG